ncbi:hypothetical protein PybrP1_009767, partial [[Pythium] brassicae (nom. inval.)]
HSHHIHFRTVKRVRRELQHAGPATERSKPWFSFLYLIPAAAYRYVVGVLMFLLQDDDDAPEESGSAMLRGEKKLMQYTMKERVERSCDPTSPARCRDALRSPAQDAPELVPTESGNLGVRWLGVAESDLVMYMKDRRREEKVFSTAGMMQFIIRHHSQWLTEDVDGKASRKVAYASLQRLLQRFCTRHGFS